MIENYQVLYVENDKPLAKTEFSLNLVDCIDTCERKQN